MRKFVLIAVLGATACAVPVDADPRAQLFRSLIVQNGCMMTDDEADIILAANGFDQDETREISRVWIERGTATLSPDRNAIILLDGECAA